MFFVTLKDSFLVPKLIFALKSISQMIPSNLFKRDPMLYFYIFVCHNLLFGTSGLNCEFIHREYGFYNKFENNILDFR